MMRAGLRTAGALVVLAALAPAPVPARAAPPAWTVDAENSRITFSARQMGVPVPGRFRRFEARIRFDPGDPAASTAEIVIDVASVETPNQDIQKEITREPWFHVARFPTARFAAETFVHRGGARYDARGTLTLRGVTRKVTLPATIRIADDPNEPGMLRGTATGEVSVKRTDFGIGQGQWRDTAIVADEVVIKIDILARRPKGE